MEDVLGVLEVFGVETQEEVDFFSLLAADGVAVVAEGDASARQQPFSSESAFAGDDVSLLSFSLPPSEDAYKLGKGRVALLMLSAAADEK